MVTLSQLAEGLIGPGVSLSRRLLLLFGLAQQGGKEGSLALARTPWILSGDRAESLGTSRQLAEGLNGPGVDLSRRLLLLFGLAQLGKARGREPPATRPGLSRGPARLFS